MRHNDLGAHFTGFKFDRGITCLYFWSFLLKIIRYSVVFMFLSVVSMHTHVFLLPLLSHVSRWTFFTISRRLRLRDGDENR